jgi:uncharacterized protein
MKKLLYFAGMVVLIMACSSEKVNFSQLQDRNGLYYLVNKDKPFSGDVISYIGGKVEFEGKIENGLKTGVWTYYYPTGQKKTQGSYTDGLKDGNWTSWKENGQQDVVEVFKFGKILRNDGTLEEVKKDSVPQPAPNTPPVVTEKKTPEPVKPAPQPEKRLVKKDEAVVWERLHGGPVKTLDGKPYSGAVVKYWPNGNKELYGYFQYGKRAGKWTYYDKLGNVKDVKYY